MKHTHLSILLLLALIPLSVIIIFIFFFYLYRIRKYPSTQTAASEYELTTDTEQQQTGNLENDDYDLLLHEEFICFEGGEDLKSCDILDAPGEVIGKSSYGTLYAANLATNHSILVLRFLRPACSAKINQVFPAVQAIGSVRHTNLAPLRAFYVGPRGEKLLVHPFYAHGNLAQFIKDGSNGCRNWDVIYNICLGLVKGLAHLHTGFEKPIIHGNLKSKNVLLGQDNHPYLCDYGLYLLLNPTAGQKMLESSATLGYKAPELMKMKDVNESTDIYSLGIILLELVTCRQPIDSNSVDPQEIYLPNVIRSAILDHNIKDLYHPDIVVDQTGKYRQTSEDRVLKLVQLAMACCSSSPSLRPHIGEVVRKIEEIGK